MQNKCIKNTIYIKLLRLKKQGEIIPYKPLENGTSKEYGGGALYICILKEEILKNFITPNYLKRNNLPTNIFLSIFY